MPPISSTSWTAERSSDHEGTEPAGVDKARAEAVALSGAMLKDAGRDAMALQVLDEAGAIVLRFSAEHG